MAEVNHNNKWIICNGYLAEVNKLAKKHGISKVLAKLLINRNIKEDKEVELFLEPGWKSLYDPMLMSDIDIGAGRVFEAIEAGENILVYGDYDVDGITSVTVLCDFLKKKGAKVDFLIPHRFDDGYGLSYSALEKIKEKPDLIITVDCGINSQEEITWLNEENIDVIVTDHHVQVGLLPPALAVINPKRSDCSFPFKELSGVGVVFNLLWAMLCYEKGEENIDAVKEELEPYLDLVALGTIADLVPLVGENRFFALGGLENFGNKRVGLKALLQVAGLKRDDLDINVGHIAFGIAPRLNAAGRLESASEAALLLMEEHSFERALERAKKLDEENKQRRELEKKVFQEASQQIEEKNLLETDYVLVLASENWHEGVVGIAASKLVDRYNRPVVLLSVDGEEAKGSCRSITPFNIVRALSECGEVLKKYGGHEAAAGVSLDTHNLEEFKDKINAIAKDKLTPEDLIPYIDIDMVVPGHFVDMGLAKEIERLEPYGMGNPRPVLASTFQLQNLRKVGKDKNHVKLSFSDGNWEYDGIWFEGTDKLPSLKDESFTKVAFTPKINSKSRNNFDLQVIDLKCQEYNKKIFDYRGYNKGKVLKGLERKESSFVTPFILVNTYSSKKRLEERIKGDFFKVISFNELKEIDDNVKSLILFDLPFDGDVLGDFVRSNMVERIYLMYNEEDKKKNEILWEGAIPDKNTVKDVFIEFLKLSEEEGLTHERIKEISKRNGFENITSRLVEKILEILFELKILEKREDKYIINGVSEGKFLDEEEVFKGIDLNTSGVYLDERKRLQTISKWEKFFLELPSVVIFQILFEDNLQEVNWLLV